MKNTLLAMFAVMAFMPSTFAREGAPAGNRRVITPPTAPQMPYHFAERPAPPPGTKFDTIAAVALTPDLKTIYVADTISNHVLKLVAN
jgi:hypothetical protein